MFEKELTNITTNLKRHLLFCHTEKNASYQNFQLILLCGTFPVIFDSSE